MVHDTNLVTPKLAIALRGFPAIKEYFENLQSRTYGKDSDEDEKQEETK